MRILITGGTGLIGRPLTKTLATQGHQVTILSRNPAKHQAGMPEATLVQWDGRTPAGWGHLIAETDAVINLAGASIAGESLTSIITQGWSPERKNYIRQSRTDAGQALVQAIEAAETRPGVLIQASAVGYYGPHGDEPLSEDSPPGDDFMANVCVDWENSTSAVEALGVRRVIIRTGLVLTKEGGILPMMLLPIRLFVGGPLGSGRQYVSWIHIRDEVQAILFLLENRSASGPYNLTAPNPVTYAQFVKIAGKIMKRPSFFPTPALALKLVLGEKATLVLDGQRVIPSRLLEAGYPFIYEDLAQALNDLN